MFQRAAENYIPNLEGHYAKFSVPRKIGNNLQFLKRGAIKPPQPIPPFSFVSALAHLR